MTAKTGYSPPLLARSWHEIGPLPARGHPPGAISSHVAAQALSTGWWIYLAQAYELAELRTVRLVRVRALPRRRGGQCRLRERLDLCRKAALASRRSTIRPSDYAGPVVPLADAVTRCHPTCSRAGAPPDGLGASPRPARTPTRGVPARRHIRLKSLAVMRRSTRRSTPVTERFQTDARVAPSLIFGRPAYRLD